jgi:hypothetical protein
VGLERGPLSLMSTFEELLERKSSASGLEIENTVVGILHADHVAPSILKSCLSIGIIRPWTQAMEYSKQLGCWGVEPYPKAKSHVPEPSGSGGFKGPRDMVHPPS